MNKILPIILVVVLSGCSGEPSTTVISSSEHKINIKYRASNVSADDLIEIGNKHCSQYNKVVFNPIFTSPGSPLADGLPLIAFSCSDKYVITKKDHEKIQNAIAVYSRIETSSTKKIAGRECKVGPLSKLGRAIEIEEKHRNGLVDRAKRTQYILNVEYKYGDGSKTRELEKSLERQMVLVTKINNKIELLLINKAIQDLKMINTARISKIWSDYAGRKVIVYPRPDCRFDIEIDGKLFEGKVSEETVIKKFKQITNTR